MIKTKVCKSEHGVEVFVDLGKGRGLYVTVDEETKRDLTVTVVRAQDGCPWGFKPEFRKVFRRGI